MAKMPSVAPKGMAPATARAPRAKSTLGSVPVASTAMRRTASMVSAGAAPSDAVHLVEQERGPRVDALVEDVAEARDVLLEPRGRPHGGGRIARWRAPRLRIRWVPMAARPCRGPLTAPMAASTQANGLARVERRHPGGEGRGRQLVVGEQHEGGIEGAHPSRRGPPGRQPGPELGGDGAGRIGVGRARPRAGACGRTRSASSGPCVERCRGGGRHVPRRPRRSRRRRRPGGRRWARSPGGWPWRRRRRRARPPGPATRWAPRRGATRSRAARRPPRTAPARRASATSMAAVARGCPSVIWVRPDARTTSTEPGPSATGAGPSPAGEAVDLVGVEPRGAAVVADGAVEQAPADVGVDGGPLHAEAGRDLVGGEEVASHQH